jgi:hypothetical protein
MWCGSSLHLYKGTPRGEFDTSGLSEFLEELSSPLPYAPPLFSLAQLPRLESCQRVRWYSTYHTMSGCRTFSPNTSSSAALLDWIRKESWWSKHFFFHCSAGLDPKGVMVSHTCVSTMRYYTCGTMSLRRCYRTCVVAPGRRGVVASSSSWPWGRLHRLHHQRMCGGVIPAFGLRGYVPKSLLIVTVLLDK